MNKNLLSYLKNLSILFAEDDTNLRKNVVEYLKLLFKEVHIAQDGEIAFDLYYEKRPDIILTDIDMPRMNGIEFLRAVRKHDNHTPALIMTAHTNTEYLIDAVELNITRYIVKPFVGDDFLSALEKVFTNLDKVYKLSEDVTYSFTSKYLELSDEKRVKLTKKESRLLELLIENQNQLTSYEEIDNQVWTDIDDIMSSETLRTLIKSLRKKVPKGIIKNVSGSGYRLEIS